MEVQNNKKASTAAIPDLVQHIGNPPACKFLKDMFLKNFHEWEKAIRRQKILEQNIFANCCSFFFGSKHWKP